MIKTQQNLNLQHYTINDNKNTPTSTLILIIIESTCNNICKKRINNVKDKHKESLKVKSVVDIDNKLLLSKVSKVIGQVKKAPMSCPNKPIPLNAGFKREGTTIKYLPVNPSKKKQTKTILSFSITTNNKQPEKDQSLGCKKNHTKFNLNLIK